MKRLGSDAAMILHAVIFMVGFAIALLGAALASSASHALKRVVGAVIGFAGAALVLSELGVSEVFLIAASAIAFAHILFGAALVVRLKETYGGLDVADMDAADRESEPKERVS